MGEIMQNARHTIATVTATTVLVGLCAFVGVTATTAAHSGSALLVSAAGVSAPVAADTDDESWH
ncbi:hypothetical protein M8Z33_39310 [Streptomyces sp. ZAF1911]|uniref:hypothetical protein n=1 Tax=unclassified Streptomyces TaxID=2593676 RepID=UPI00237A375E|nr:hypothetical protein [Streptomyces sp. ZAF1911]MDD9382586.1 hypothetical protein [Streptomyces sp. ZAF1911]